MAVWTAGDTEMFSSGEEAWLWACSALRARHDQCGGDRPSIRRPCDPDDVLICITRLHRAGTLQDKHIKSLSLLTATHSSPSPTRTPTLDYALWQQAMGKLEAKLIEKGIVQPVQLVGKKSLTVRRSC